MNFLYNSGRTYKAFLKDNKIINLLYSSQRIFKTYIKIMNLLMNNLSSVCEELKILLFLLIKKFVIEFLNNLKKIVIELLKNLKNIYY